MKFNFAAQIVGEACWRSYKLTSFRYKSLAHSSFWLSTPSSSETLEISQQYCKTPTDHLLSMENPGPDNPPVEPYMPPTIKFNEPLNGTENEVDFSTFKYFMLFGNKKVFLGDDEVMRLVLTPRADNQPLFTHLMMTREGGVAHVAHLPNITDMKRRVDLGVLKDRLLSIIEDEPGVPPAQSGFYLELADPAPVLDFARPSHPLQLGTFIAEIGTYTDAFQVKHSTTQQ